MKRMGASGPAIAGLALGLLIGAGITYGLASAVYGGIGKATAKASTATSTLTAKVTITQSQVSETTITTTATSLHTVTTTASGASGISYVSLVPGASINSTHSSYSPSTLVVVIGVNNTVVWANNDNAPHTVTSSSTAQPFNSGNLNPGQIFVFTFTKPGAFSYACAYHGWMHGIIVVKA